MTLFSLSKFSEPEPVKKKKSKRGSFRDLLVKNDISASIASVHDAKEMIKQEIDAYLSTPDTEDIKQELSKYPYIRELFRASNCIRSSEAICERMFSYAGLSLFNNHICIFSITIIYVNRPHRFLEIQSKRRLAYIHINIRICDS